MSTILKVATAIARVNKYAGWRDGANNSQAHRAKRLISCGYIHKGDPYGWSHNATATILMEPKGGRDDCEIPFNGYDFGIVHEVSRKMGAHYIEFINAAVAAVHRLED